MKIIRPLLIAVPLALITFLAFKKDIPEPVKAVVSPERKSTVESIPLLSRSSPEQKQLDSSDSAKGAGAAGRGVTASSVVKQELTEPEQRSLWQAFSEARREVREIPEAWAEREENLGYDFYALHPQQNLSTRFGAEGVQLVSSDRTYTAEDANHPTTAWQVRLRLRAFAGREVAAGAAPEKSAVSGSRVEYRHAPGLTEWYDNGVEAMEHGFTVAGRPSHLRAGDEVVLEMSLEGLQAAGWNSEQGNLVFQDGEREVLGYEKLVVFDADGKELSARMEATGDGFLLAYHDTGARYPVTVDPLIVNQEAKINRNNVVAGDNFGTSVSVSGDTAVIGAPGADGVSVDSGAAYVFTLVDGSYWIMQAKLEASDGEAFDLFGATVSIHQDTVVVGANSEDGVHTNSGSAYVFIRIGTTWTQQAKLTASDAAAFDYFGISVSVSGDTAVVGAYFDDEGASTSSGSAYIFTRSAGSWSQQARLVASDAAASDTFGSSVSVSGETVVVGAPTDDDAGGNSGSAYVFIRSGSTWSQQAKLVASDDAAGDQFGVAVSLSGNTVAIGANRDDGVGNDSGSAYIFIRSGVSWSQQSKLVASDAESGDRFGSSVSLSGDNVAIGAPLRNAIYVDSPDLADVGAAYVFSRAGTTWTQVNSLDPIPRRIGLDFDGNVYETQTADDRFGTSVAISGNTVIVGSPNDDDGGFNSGSADWYALVPGFLPTSPHVWEGQASFNHFQPTYNDQFGFKVSHSGDTVAIRAGSGVYGFGIVYVFTRNGGLWTQEDEIVDSGYSPHFGRSLSLSGDTLLVGSLGAAYVYARSGGLWTQQALLTPSDSGGPSKQFGYSVSLSGDTAVVGAYLDDDEGIDSGSAYVFVRSSGVWTQQAKLTAADAGAEDQFGVAVSVSGETIVVGANWDVGSGTFDTPGPNWGSAYVFARIGGTWIQEANLKGLDSGYGPSSGFGTSVSLDGVTVAVGSDSNGTWIYTRNSDAWIYQEKLIPSGGPVSLSGDMVVIGAPSLAPSSSGSAFVFTRYGNSWIQGAEINASDGAVDDRFGTSVSLFGDTLIVGATGDDDGYEDTGSVYIYRLTVPSVRRLVVKDHLGNPVSHEGNASAFQTQRNGTVRDYLFTLTNEGALTLNLQSISLGGADAGQYSLVGPDFSSSVELTQSQSLNLTINFQPTGASGLRNATLEILSNDSFTTAYSVNLSGLGLSDTADSEGDGMSDWSEYALRGYGFDWESAQDDFVSDFYALAPDAGLVTLDQVAGLQANTTLLNVNPATQRAELTIQLKQSDDLEGFTPIRADPARISVDGQGRIVYEVDAPEGKRFYIMGVGP